MNIGFISYKYGDIDGVSLTDQTLITGLRKLGHNVVILTGEANKPTDDNVSILPALGFNHPEIHAIKQFTIEANSSDKDITQKIEQLSKKLYSDIQTWLQLKSIDILFLTNIFSIGFNLPLAIALNRLCTNQKIKIISRDCDFWWQREYFIYNPLQSLFEEYLPPANPLIKHVVINAHSQEELYRRKGLKSDILPDLFDFDYKYPADNTHSGSLRSVLGIKENELMLLQPSRIVRRKRVDRGILLAHYLKNKKFNPCVVTTGFGGDEDDSYTEEVTALSKKLQVRAFFISDMIKSTKYSIYDCYPSADLVVFLSESEGFGNQLVESVFFKKPLLINSYKVYSEEIKPKGFKFIEADGGQITPDIISQITELSQNNRLRTEIVEHNFEIARKHYSLESNLTKLQSILEMD